LIVEDPFWAAAVLIEPVGLSVCGYENRWVGGIIESGRRFWSVFSAFLTSCWAGHRRASFAGRADNYCRLRKASAAAGLLRNR